jgi:hypothetical protein
MTIFHEELKMSNAYTYTQQPYMEPSAAAHMAAIAALLKATVPPPPAANPAAAPAVASV